MSTADLFEMRIQELAAGIALGDISEAESQELKSYDPTKLFAMVERSEIAAANAYLTFQNSTIAEPLPAELAFRLESMALGFLAESEKQKDAPELVPLSLAPLSVGIREAIAWLCVAASIAIALCVWIPVRNGPMVAVQTKRNALIDSATDLLRSKWESPAPNAPAGAELGEVVWSSISQEGYMTIRNLPVNDATKEQYQLWIFDPSRDEKPIDGGVFDITSLAENIVPIRAKLTVGKPTLFAITVEKPGGVVVSDQTRLPLLAKVLF